MACPTDVISRKFRFKLLSLLLFGSSVARWKPPVAGVVFDPNDQPFAIRNRAHKMEFLLHDSPNIVPLKFIRP